LYWFRVHNPAPGVIYNVDGHKMHKMRLDCMGSGAPTIILESGLGNGGLIWAGVQPELAKTTRVCAYDRAGLGWSDRSDEARDADHIASQLHGLLMEAKITGPIVLMGHSIAGIYMRDYATRFPEGLEGIVFVDGSTPLQDDNPAFKAEIGSKLKILVMVGLERAAYIVGVPRLVSHFSDLIPNFEPHTKKMFLEDYLHTHFGVVGDEIEGVHASGLETVKTGPYGSTPILIFSQDPMKSLPKQNPPQRTVMMAKVWGQMQEDLKKLSTRSRRIVAKDSTHYIQLDRPDLIKKEVPAFIEQIRGAAPEPAVYGTTITE